VGDQVRSSVSPFRIGRVSAVASQTSVSVVTNGQLLGAQGVQGTQGATGATGAAGAQGVKGAGWYAWNTASNLTNISSISGMAIGDYVVNTGTATRTILGVSTVIGGIVRAASATTGTAVGNIRGATGANGTGSCICPSSCPFTMFHNLQWCSVGNKICQFGSAPASGSGAGNSSNPKWCSAAGLVCGNMP
jgi:hypothetical protein